MSVDPALVAQAAHALIDSGRGVEQIEDYPLWAVEGERSLLNDDDLIVMACLLGVLDDARRAATT